MLPVATRERWQPLRAGLVDLFLYDVEEFRFREGNLLLRGNNGTGKSKVLALLLPFLLDGEVSPHRVEPDGDPGKRMEWNLLMGSRYSQRTGYAWLELGRVDGDGRGVYLTLGCGLKAVAGRGAPARWFFLTDRRVGENLDLINPSGTAKTRERLAESLGEGGTVVERAGAWRRLLDERLFDLGSDRYEALLSLLIQLRQPQLSKRPDEQALSTALTRALAPLDQAVLGDVAQAFRSLEAERADLAALVEASTAVDSFLDRYRRYAAIAVRRAAGVVTEAQYAYRKAGERLGEAEAALATAQAQEDAAARAAGEAEDTLAAARTRDRALRESPVMQDAATLDEVARAARQAGVAAQTAHARAVEADDDHRDAEARHDEADREERSTAADADRARADAHAAADTAGVVREHAEALRGVGASAVDAAAGRRATDAVAQRRTTAVRHVVGLVQAADAAAATLTDARRRHGEAETDLQARTDEVAAAEQAVTGCGERHVAAVRTHLAALTELAIGDADTLADDLLTWTRTLEGENPARMQLRAAHGAAVRRLAAEDERLRTEAERIEADRSALEAEQRTLAAGAHTPPPVPHTRLEGVRDARPGAPLWRLVDVADGVGDAERAGLEAALEASGLLDAWVTPDGLLLDAATLDVVVTAGEMVDNNLGIVLEPGVHRGTADAEVASPEVVDPEVVAAVLVGIGLGPGSGATWVATDGRFRVGALEGRWHKDTAAHLGQAAREAARRRRLEVLTAELADLGRRRAELDAARRDLKGRAEQAEAEHAGLPADGEVRDAHSARRAASAARRQAQERTVALAATVARANTAADEAGAARDTAAADLRLPTTSAALDLIATAIGEYRGACAGLWPTLAAADRAARRRTEAVHLADAARGRAGRARADSAAAGDAARETAVRHETLRSTVGQAVEELLAQLAETEARISQAEVARTAAADDHANRVRATAGAETAVGLLAEQADDAARRRSDATESLRRFAATGLSAVAAPEVGIPPLDAAWAADPTVRLARRLDAALADITADDAAWERASGDITGGFTVLSEALTVHGHHASSQIAGGHLVVTVEFRQQQVPPDHLAALLQADRAAREQLLSARERELLENHLVAEVAAHLQELISGAEAQVAAVNVELAARPTSTGMQLRLVWQPARDAPEGLDRARARLLRQTSAVWSDEDRAAVGAFLQARIDAVRAASETGTWLEHLTEALDYRAWHAFAVERRQDGVWRSASGPASGGERALAATVPLFAAASSFYSTAGNPHAPRLVMLDEAFAGVDDDARAKCLGLLAEFDLDVVMTSEREWACYPTVPGIAIAQLARREGLDAIHVTSWEWDGRVRRRLDVPRPSLRTADDDADPVGLW